MLTIILQVDRPPGQAIGVKEQVVTYTMRKRGCGATHCYGCLCDTCANSVELLSWYVTIGEAVEPCFSCDDCRHYDGDIRKQDQWHETCPRYVEAKRQKTHGSGRKIDLRRLRTGEQNPSILRLESLMEEGCRQY